MSTSTVGSQRLYLHPLSERNARETIERQTVGRILADIEAVIEDHKVLQLQVLKAFSDAARKSEDCFNFLKRLHPNISYRFTCHSKGSSKFSFEFENIDELLHDVTISDEDKKSREPLLHLRARRPLELVGKAEARVLLWVR